MLMRDHTVLPAVAARLFTSGMNDACVYFQPQSFIAFWSVLISHPAEGRRLSWPGEAKLVSAEEEHGLQLCTPSPG